MAEHVVFLVPGLLGFERISTFSYFADRVVSALRASLEQALQQPVHVVAVPVPPTAALSERQRKLVRTLADRVEQLELRGPKLQVHLVGHSTGGLDGELLTHQTALGGAEWNELDPRGQALVERIRSLTCIASPQQGACLAVDPVAKFLCGRELSALPVFLKLVGKFALCSLGDVDLHNALDSAQHQSLKTARFVADVLSTWALLGDLDPARVPSAGVRRDGVLRRSFVTISGRPVKKDADHEPADAFFRELSARASGLSTGAVEQGPLLGASVTRLRNALLAADADALLIKAEGVVLPERFDAGANDGVVNSARQLAVPSDPHELASIVVADHFDVVGHYDRYEWVTKPDGHDARVQVLSGLLHSGSAFRDAEFFELYRRVAAVIASSTMS